jgi:hypothetical protein
VLVGADQPLGYNERDGGLPDATRSDDGKQTLYRQSLDQVVNDLLPADQAGQLGRQIMLSLDVARYGAGR